MADSKAIELRKTAVLELACRHPEGVPLKALAPICANLGGQPGSEAKKLEEQGYVKRHWRLLRGGLTLITPTAKGARKIGVNENFVRLRGSLASPLGISVMWECQLGTGKGNSVRLYNDEVKKIFGSDSLPPNAVYIGSIKENPTFYRAYLIESSSVSTIIRNLKTCVEKLSGPVFDAMGDDLKVMGFVENQEVKEEVDNAISLSELKEHVEIRSAPRGENLATWLKGGVK